METISSWVGYGLVYEHILIPSWIQNTLPDDPMSSCFAAKKLPLSETAGYLELDSYIPSVIRHAISARTPMIQRIKTKLGTEDLCIIRKQLSEHGISAFILDGPGYL